LSCFFFFVFSHIYGLPESYSCVSRTEDVTIYMSKKYIPRLHLFALDFDHKLSPPSIPSHTLSTHLNGRSTASHFTL
jgi:hypothetical protein